MIIEWSDKFSIGNEEIDLQHQKLFKLVNDLLKSQDKITILECSRKTSSYINEHFSLEEEYMRTINYPDYIKHIKQHDALTINLNRIRFDMIKEEFDLELSKKFFYDWVNYHILVEDFKLLNYKA